MNEGLGRKKIVGTYMVGYVHHLPRPRNTIAAHHDIRKIPLIYLHIAVVVSSKGTYLHVVTIDTGLRHAFEVLSECLIDGTFGGPDDGLVCTGGGLSFRGPAGWAGIEEEFEVLRVCSHI